MSVLSAFAYQRSTVHGGRGAWADALTYRYAEGTNRLARVDEYEDPALDGTPSENPTGHEHSAAYAGRFDYDEAGRLTRERSGSSGPAVRRQVERYSAASLPVRLDVPAAADPVHGGVRLEYRYDGAGQRVQEVVQARLGVDKDDPDPSYQKRVWLRHGDGRAAGVLDGDGRLVSWSLYGAGLAGRIEPGQDTPPDVGEATERAAADSAQAALERYAVAGALAEANQVHALGLSEAEVKQAAAGAVQAAEAETRAAAAGSVSMAALASHDEIGGAYVAEAEAPLREALYGELVGLGVPEAAALTAATEAAKGAAAEGGTAAGLAVKPGGVAGYRWRYYHADHLGSVRAVTDGYGRVVEATDYYVYGLQMPGRVWRSDSETREGYTGHELDPETGLNYAGARYYDSALARWHVIDPLWAQFPSYSPCNYVLGDPVNLIDPDGMAPDPPKWVTSGLNFVQTSLTSLYSPTNFHEGMTKFRAGSNQMANASNAVEFVQGVKIQADGMGQMTGLIENYASTISAVSGAEANPLGIAGGLTVSGVAGDI